MTPPFVTIHILHSGYPLCRFTGRMPGQWPAFHIWIRKEEYASTVAACAEADHDLHAVMRYRICAGCEVGHLAPNPLAELVTPAEGRACEHCAAPLVPAWPAVYCSNECALLDAEGSDELDPETRAGRLAMLGAMQHAAAEFYRAATRIRCHAFIEFTGLMNEFIKLCREAESRALNWTRADVHGREHLPFLPHHIHYLSEKLMCIYGIKLHDKGLS